MSEKKKTLLDIAAETVDAKYGTGASADKPELVAAVLQKLPGDFSTAVPAISNWRLLFAMVLFVWWLALLIGGYEVNSEKARRVLRGLGQTLSSQGADSPAATPNSASNVSRILIFKVYIDGAETTAGTNMVTLPAAASVEPPVDLSFLNVIKASLIAMLFWTWPNLILLASAASALGAVLTRPALPDGRGVASEIGWSMVNGFFVVIFLGCGQIFLGDTVYRSLGLTEALQIQLKQDRYLTLAFFASLLGLFLGLANQRLNALPGKLPVIGPLFK